MTSYPTRRLLTSVATGAAFALCSSLLVSGAASAAPAAAPHQEVAQLVEARAVAEAASDGSSKSGASATSKTRQTAAQKKAAKKRAAAKKKAAKKRAAAKKKAAKKRAAAKKKTAFNKLLKTTVTPTLTAAQVQRIAALARTEPKPNTIKRDPAEPASAAAWQRMFYALPTTQWGGGDVSVSARLESGRRLWMYGDTLSSNNKFVHSTAIVTYRKTAHVANRGGHVLPTEPAKDGRKTVYWTETVRPVRGEYAVVTTTPVSLNMGGDGSSFDFYRVNKKSRQALVHVNADGDVRFLGWVGWVPRPDIGMDGEDFRSPQPGHYTYGAYVHAIRLSNGKFLRTRNRNYDSLDRMRKPDGTLRYEMWRPTFEESPTRTNPYWGH